MTVYRLLMLLSVPKKPALTDTSDTVCEGFGADKRNWRNGSGKRLLVNLSEATISANPF
jgi:hypothetical protein